MAIEIPTTMVRLSRAAALLGKTRTIIYYYVQRDKLQVYTIDGVEYLDRGQVEALKARIDAEPKNGS